LALGSERGRGSVSVAVLHLHAAALDQPDRLAVPDHQLSGGEIHESGYALAMYVPRNCLPLLGFHYDIRAIDEDLYLAVLACRRAESRCAAGDLTSTPTPAPGTAGDYKGP
jgi:hypothetical protein